MNNESYKKFETCIDNREKITLNGVNNIESFEEDHIILKTALGEVCIEGENLKVESLTKESGEILIIGKINGLFYKDKFNEKGFLRKLFK